MENKKEKFKDFTNLYELSKTLRFELKPVGKTIDNMKEHLEYDSKLQIFMKEQAIEDAYQILKPIIDDIHEEFITNSLESDKAKEIDFSKFLGDYKQKKDDKGEKNLRNEIGETYSIGEEKLKKQYQSLKWKKGSSEAKGFNVLLCQDILEVVRDRYKDDVKIQKALVTFKGFFTYFSGFNQNRENYYETKDEKATAVATRIIHENLPKFCDNAVQFECITKKKKDGAEEKIIRKEEYLNAYQYLKGKNKTTQIKNAESNEMIEAYPIEEKYFDISYFNFCLSQGQIEEYNKIIGHYNLLINLYNQAKLSEEKGLDKKDRIFKKLHQFKTLFKQIGCGKRDSLFFSLKYDKECELSKEEKEKTNEIFSVEKVLEFASQAGEKYFVEKSDDNVVDTIPELIDWLKYNCGNWTGIYWSSKAINTISNKYFANWHSIIELIQDNHKEYKNVATYNKQREQQIKLNDAVEISGLFELLDKVVEENKEKWWEDFFKKDVWEDKKRLEIIKNENSPSRALVALLFLDIKEHAEKFNDNSKSILELGDYKIDENKKKIKAWMDDGLAVNQMLKYFLVNENKVKGDTLNGDLVNILNTLIRGESKEVDWFKWYDALRNYLTKKPQDDVKENKLKLNFECSSLLGGWSDGQEKVKKAVILRNGKQLYLGILRKSSIFDTKNKENNLMYTTTTTDSERLILANLKFQTLAGKGFLGKFGMSYGNMGKENSLRAVECLKEIIKERYVNKYKLLKEILTKKYNNKKDFDKDIQEILKNCYMCEFELINWTQIEKQIELGNLYVFKISNKSSNLQNIYWEDVFRKNSFHQLNGGGEIFYRKKGIGKKKVKKGYEKKPWVIEGKRFTRNEDLEDSKKNVETDGKSFFFHCPIKLNYKSTGNSNPKYALPENNRRVNDSFAISDTYFLGLDRGEKHLIYYSLVDQQGNMVPDGQGSLNLEFKDKNGKVRSIKKIKRVYNKADKKWEEKEVECWNYNDLLDVAASNRDEARKNWQTIGNIRNLKEGYISQVIHEIVKKVTDKPTFVVLEDLNTGFKRERQKIEKQVYQKFELALAKKLNFVVDKSKEIGEIGSVTKALQLTPPVANYQDIENKKQVGIMLYTRANYTSQTDPLTGWRKTIYLKKGSEQSIKDQIIGNGKIGKDEIKPAFTDIGFDGKDYFFEYSDKNVGKKWKLWSGKDGKDLVRYRGKRTEDKNIWETEKMELKKQLDKIFEDFDKDRSFLVQIRDERINIKKSDDKFTAWESLRFVIDLIQQIRNSGGENTSKENDNFLLSPIRDENGKHFDSREIKKEDSLPIDADANGAFNIARKGIIMNEHIKQWKKNGENKYDLDLFISDQEWDLWLADKSKWKKMLSIFASRKEMEELRKNRIK